MAKLRSLEEEFKLMGHVLSEDYMKAQEKLALGENYGEDETKTEMSPGSEDENDAQIQKSKVTQPPAVGSTVMKNEGDDEDGEKDGDKDGEDEKSEKDGEDKTAGEKPWDKEKGSEEKAAEKKKDKKNDEGKFAAKVDQKPSAGPDESTPKADLPGGKRAAGESTDKLEVLMSELHKLTESAGAFDSDKKRLTRIYSNIAVVADVLSQRLHEGDELGASFDKLAEDALMVAEGITYGKIPLENARKAVKGYVKDLTAAVGPIAEELDHEQEPAPRLLAKK